MDNQTILDAVLLTASTVTGWFARELWTAVKELKADLAKLREEMPRTYVLREDYRQDIRELKDMMNKLFDKLDNKSDK